MVPILNLGAFFRRRLAAIRAGQDRQGLSGDGATVRAGHGRRAPVAVVRRLAHKVGVALRTLLPVFEARRSTVTADLGLVEFSTLQKAHFGEHLQEDAHLGAPREQGIGDDQGVVALALGLDRQVARIGDAERRQAGGIGRIGEIGDLGGALAEGTDGGEPFLKGAFVQATGPVIRMGAQFLGEIEDGSQAPPPLLKGDKKLGTADLRGHRHNVEAGFGLVGIGDALYLGQVSRLSQDEHRRRYQ